jgi:hypothetical protein
MRVQGGAREEDTVAAFADPVNTVTAKLITVTSFI